MADARKPAHVETWTINDQLPGHQKLDLESLSKYTLPRHNGPNLIVWIC